MEKRKDSSKNRNIHPRLILRLRIYLIVMLAMFVGVIFELIQTNFSIIGYVLIGLIMGLVVGAIVSRMYNITLDEESNNVIGTIDGIGAIILVCYLIFVFTKTSLLGNFVQGTSLIAIILSITACTMLGRIIGIRHNINLILQAVKI